MYFYLVYYSNLTMRVLDINEKQFRSIVLWLEDQKIRHYTIQDREQLRNIDGGDWNGAYDKYKKDLMCPITSKNQLEELSWLLSYAVQLDFSDNSRLKTT